MKKIFLFFVLTTNLLGSGQKSVEAPTFLRPQSYDFARIESLTHRFVDMLSQDSFPDDFQESNIFPIAQEIDAIIRRNAFNIDLPRLIQERRETSAGQESTSESQGNQQQMIQELIRETMPTFYHVASILAEANQNLFAKCIERNWFETANWIMEHSLPFQEDFHCDTIIREACCLAQKYNDAQLPADATCYQDMLSDLHKATALATLIRTMRTHIYAQDSSIYENLTVHLYNLITLEQFLSIISNLKILISRIETESNEADLDQLKTNLDQAFSTANRSSTLIHHIFNRVVLPKNKQFLSLIDLCTEKRFFSTILWAVGKGVPLRADQIVKMIDVARKYLQNKDAYLCEKEDLFSLLHLIIQAVKQNMMSEGDKETLEQLQPKILSEITKVQEMEQHLPEGISLPFCTLPECTWSQLLSLIKSKLQGRWDPKNQWSELSVMQEQAKNAYKLFQESRSSLNEEMINLVKEQQDLISEVIRLLSLNPSMNLCLKISASLNFALIKNIFPM